MILLFSANPPKSAKFMVGETINTNPAND